MIADFMKEIRAKNKYLWMCLRSNGITICNIPGIFLGHANVELIN